MRKTNLKKNRSLKMLIAYREAQHRFSRATPEGNIKSPKPDAVKNDQKANTEFRNV